MALSSAEAETYAMVCCSAELLGAKIKPSAMRVEYKVHDKSTGVRRRVQLTPASELSQLKRAESIIITPYN